MLVMVDISISAFKFYPVRITRSGFPLYVITYVVILIGVGLMSQGIVEAGDWHVCGVCMFQSTVGGGEGFQFMWMLSLFSVVSLVLSVIGGISDPTVPVPFVA